MIAINNISSVYKVQKKEITDVDNVRKEVEQNRIVRQVLKNCYKG